ncbi:hypothetical protein BOX15_Mlig021734g1, partial [Macrostomum lignano]
TQELSTLRAAAQSQEALQDAERNELRRARDSLQDQLAAAKLEAAEYRKAYESAKEAATKGHASAQDATDQAAVIMAYCSKLQTGCQTAVTTLQAALQRDDTCTAPVSWDMAGVVHVDFSTVPALTNRNASSATTATSCRTTTHDTPPARSEVQAAEPVPVVEQRVSISRAYPGVTVAHLAYRRMMAAVDGYKCAKRAEGPNVERMADAALRETYRAVFTPRELRRRSYTGKTAKGLGKPAVDERKKKAICSFLSNHGVVIRPPMYALAYKRVAESNLRSRKKVSQYAVGAPLNVYSYTT